MGWVVNATPRPLYPRERPGSHCVGGWVGPRTGLEGYEKFRPHRNSIPGPKSIFKVQLKSKKTVQLFVTQQRNFESCLQCQTQVTLLFLTREAGLFHFKALSE
jgi:hypothetical protein